LDILIDVLSQIKQNKTAEEIQSYLLEKYELNTVLDNKNIDIIFFSNDLDREMTRFEFFFKRFNENSEHHYVFNGKFSIKNS
jgi:hypothetical protein